MFWLWRYKGSGARCCGMNHRMEASGARYCGMNHRMNYGERSDHMKGIKRCEREEEGSGWVGLRKLAGMVGAA